jgi:hypothetical protein
LIYRKRNHHPVHRWMLPEREKSKRGLPLDMRHDLGGGENLLID